MAIYHFSAKVISRSTGRSSVAAAAYRSASRLVDERQGVTHDFSSKSGVVHSEVMLCEGASGRFADRSVLWNAVEAGEKRKDAQLSREVEFAIPREMSQVEGIALARDFVEREYVSRGMIADLNVHWDFDEAGQPKPHAHVMLTMRAVNGEGFGPKVREWNATSELTAWRERWEHHVNERFAELGYELRIDHRSLAAQGSELEPQHKIGPAGRRRDARGEDAERTREHQDIAHRNGDRILADPSIALRSLTYQQSTFTRQDIARFVNRHTDSAEQFDTVMVRVEASPDLVRLGSEWMSHNLAGEGRQAASGGERFTTTEMIAVEAHLEQVALGLSGWRTDGALSLAGLDRNADGVSHGVGVGRDRGHGVSAPSIDAALTAAQARGFEPGDEQGDALRHVTSSGDLALVVGYAGTGKSAILGVAREAWEAEGYRVRGATLSGIAAEGLEAGSGIESRTIASLEWAWARDRERLTSNDILVVDEAGMVGSRQMDRVLTAAHDAGAKVVLIGDPQQLQAIEAGAAFRALQERHGAAEITEIRRQHVDWQREATRELAGVSIDPAGGGESGVAQALGRYDNAGMVHAHGTRGEAKAALIDGWNAQRQAHPDDSQMMLAYTRTDVADLNSGARARLHEAEALGEDHLVSTARGYRSFATGDRLMFLRNERSLEVKNGTLGTVVGIEIGGSGRAGVDGNDRVAASLAAERAEREGLLPYPAVPAATATDQQSLGLNGGIAGAQLARDLVDEDEVAQRLHATRLVVRLDGQDRRTVAFDLKDYDHVDHGYAATIHKTQGVTVDRAHVLATQHMDRHAAYVGLSRHREDVQLHYGQDDIKHGTRLAQVLSRDRSKDVTLDYRERFAELRDIQLDGLEPGGERQDAILVRDQAVEHELQSANSQIDVPQSAEAQIAPQIGEPDWWDDPVLRAPGFDRSLDDRSVDRLPADGPLADGRPARAIEPVVERQARLFDSERTALLFYAEAHGRLTQAEDAGHPTEPHRLGLEASRADLVVAVGSDRAADVAAAMEVSPRIGIELVKARRLPITERDAAKDQLMSDLGERVQGFETQRLARTAEREMVREPTFAITGAREREAVFDYTRAFGQMTLARTADHPTAPHEARLTKAQTALEDVLGPVRGGDVRMALQADLSIGTDLVRSRSLPVNERDAARDQVFDRLTTGGDAAAEHRMEQERDRQAELLRQRELVHERSRSRYHDLGLSL